MIFVLSLRQFYHNFHLVTFRNKMITTKTPRLTVLQSLGFHQKLLLDIMRWRRLFGFKAQFEVGDAALMSDFFCCINAVWEESLGNARDSVKTKATENNLYLKKKGEETYLSVYNAQIIIA